MRYFSVRVGLILSLLFSSCVIGDNSRVLRETNMKMRSTATPSGSVALSRIGSEDGSLRFRLRNGSIEPIFIAYERSSSDNDDLSFVPYSLRCKLGKEYEAYGPEFHFVPMQNSLPPGGEVIFATVRPEADVECELEIGYYVDANAAEMINKRPFGHSKTDEALIDKSVRRISLRFSVDK